MAKSSLAAGGTGVTDIADVVSAGPPPVGTQMVTDTGVQSITDTGLLGVVNP